MIKAYGGLTLVCWFRFGASCEWRPKVARHADYWPATRSYLSMRSHHNPASQTDTFWPTIKSIYAYFTVRNPLPPPRNLPQDAFHRFDRPFLCSLCPVFRWVTLPMYILTTFLKNISAVAHAAPPAPRGICLLEQCKFEVGWHLCKIAVA